jgi:hypothetical protein
MTRIGVIEKLPKAGWRTIASIDDVVTASRPSGTMRSAYGSVRCDACGDPAGETSIRNRSGGVAPGRYHRHS